MDNPKDIFSYTKDNSTAPASALPMTNKEMKNLGRTSCDIIIVTGDAYVDHPSFSAAVIGRTLEAQGFSVGIIAQPGWQNKDDFMKLGRPNLMFGITSGNMDSMVNHYTADLRIRSNDAYSPEGKPGKRPDRAVLAYAQRCREAYQGVPIIIGGIEASLRRSVHYDYWSDKIRKSILLDSKADLLIYGNGERQIVEIAHRLKANEPIRQITDVRGTVVPLFESNNKRKDESLSETGGHSMPKQAIDDIEKNAAASIARLPSYNDIIDAPEQLAKATRIIYSKFSSGNRDALVQCNGHRDILINPPAIPLTTSELDKVYELPYSRAPHPYYGKKEIPAFNMIKFSITIMRGCFGGCAFCAIAAHEGKTIQNRSEGSIVKEIASMQNRTAGFTGVISDLGGPTANMYRLRCANKGKGAACAKPSCVYPTICKNLDTDHSKLINLYRRVRKLPGIKKALIGSGVRYDLALKSPEYVKELATHHVGGYLKIAPEHTEKTPLSVMMKPDMACYNQFAEMFDQYSKQAGKKQYLIPYFIAAHPGTTTEDMLNLALWLKKNNYKLEQVQTFLPSPMTISTAIYYSGKNPLNETANNGKSIPVPRGLKIRRLHKAFLLYHAPENRRLLQTALKEMGREDLIGDSPKCLIPASRGSQGARRRTQRVKR